MQSSSANAVGASSSSQRNSNYVKSHCTYCDRDGHLHEFCFRRVKKEKKERLNALRQKRASSFVVPRTNAKARFLEDFHDGFKSASRTGLGFNSHNSHSDRAHTRGSGSSFVAVPPYRVSQYWIPRSYLQSELRMCHPMGLF